MKRYIITSATLLLLGLVSCDRTVIEGGLPDDVATEKSISVLRSSTILSPDSSEGYVIVKAGGEVTATSDRNWCTVTCYGDSVAVKTTSNYDHLDSRYAQVRIYDNGADFVSVTVQQAGPLTKSFDDSAIVLGHEGGDAEFSYNSNMTAEVSSSVSWATAEVEANVVKVHVGDNASKEYREGELSCRLGTETYKVVVAQFETADILSNRNWKFDGVLMDGSDFSLDGTITKVADRYTMSLSGTDISWSFPATVTGNRLNVPLGSSIGRYAADNRNYYVFPVVGEGDKSGEVSSMTAEGSIGFTMRLDKESGKWQGSLDLKPFTGKYENPVFRFEFWRTSFKNGNSSGGFRFKELNISQQ